WVDMSAQMAMMYNDMSLMCKELKLTDKELKFKMLAEEISLRINQFMWNEEDGLYYDIDDEGKQIKWKTAACFWPMLAGIADVNKAEKLLGNLKDPNSFWRKIPFPSLAADQKYYKAEGQYWLGSVWAPTNVMIIKGLDKFGVGNDLAYNFNEFAALATEEYLNGIYKVYKKTGTIWENYSAEAYARGSWSRPDFVGWSGCGPIQLLIENILGFRPNGVNNTLTWHLSRIDKHGISNLKFGTVTASLICERRESVDSPAKISIESNSKFDLIIERGHNNYKTFRINSGKQTIIME
ncbi:MAG: hypothetical protein HXY50_01260, partial [Ignavibacteriaceae bacterium]|nr:hypothetical protein [Ignavibacteriaceae bacterium]